MSLQVSLFTLTLRSVSESPVDPDVGELENPEKSKQSKSQTTDREAEKQCCRLMFLAFSSPTMQLFIVPRHVHIIMSFVCSKHVCVVYTPPSAALED